MNIPKAIEILQEKQKEYEPHWERGDREAINLSIEALKAISSFRLFANPYVKAPLPGETES